MTELPIELKIYQSQIHPLQICDSGFYGLNVRDKFLNVFVQN